MSWLAWGLISLAAAAAGAPPCAPELGTSFTIVFEAAEPAGHSERVRRERMARFIAGDLMPFLRQNFPANAGRVDLNELIDINTVIVTFPLGIRAALPDLRELENTAPQTVDRIRVILRH